MRLAAAHFGIRPANTEYVTKQLYFPDTAVLITRFLSAGGVAEISDFMPIERQWQPTDRHSIVRMVRVPRGRGAASQFEVAPRFDYGRGEHTVNSTEHGVVFDSGKFALTLHSSRRVRATGYRTSAGS